MNKLTALFLMPIFLAGCVTTKTQLKEFNQAEYEHIAGAENNLLNCYKDGFIDADFAKNSIISIKRNVERAGRFDEYVYQGILNQFKNKPSESNKESCFNMSIYGQENIDYNNEYLQNQAINQQLISQYEQQRRLMHMQNMNQSIQGLQRTYIDSLTPKPRPTINCYHYGSMTTCN